jgi:hypothetical protein
MTNRISCDVNHMVCFWIAAQPGLKGQRSVEIGAPKGAPCRAERIAGSIFPASDHVIAVLFGLDIINPCHDW